MKTKGLVLAVMIALYFLAFWAAQAWSVRKPGQYHRPPRGFLAGSLVWTLLFIAVALVW